MEINVVFDEEGFPEEYRVVRADGVVLFYTRSEHLAEMYLNDPGYFED